MKMRLDMDKIARASAKRRKGRRVRAATSARYSWLADIEGALPGAIRRWTADGSSWTERRLVPLAPRTLKRLEDIAAKVRARGGVSVEPMQLAALLLEKKTEELSEREAESLVPPEATRQAVSGSATRYKIAISASGNRRASSSLDDARELGRSLASNIIAPRRSSSAHLHRPWRARATRNSSAALPVSLPKPVFHRASFQQHHRCGRRRHRHRRPRHRPEAAREPGAAGHHRQPRRRRRHDRHRGRRQGAARRLHDRAGADEPRHQSEHLREAPLRHREGLRADHHGRFRRDPDGGAPERAAATMRGFVAAAKARPQAIANYGSAGAGTVFHLTAEAFKQATGLPLQHVPYRGGAPTITALIAGEIPLAFETTLASGRMSAPARARARHHQPEAQHHDARHPDHRGGRFPGAGGRQLLALFAPAGTPAPIVERLHEATAAALALPDLRDKLREQGAEVVANKPAELAAYVAAEIPKWAALARQAGLKPECRRRRAMSDVIIRDKAEYHARTTEQMERHLAVPTWSLRQKIALTCRILAAEGHEFALAGQITARGEKPGTYWMLSFGLGFDEARASNIVLVDDDLNLLAGDGMVNPSNRFHLWIYRHGPR